MLLLTVLIFCAQHSIFRLEFSKKKNSDTKFDLPFLSMKMKRFFYFLNCILVYTFVINTIADLTKTHSLCLLPLVMVENHISS